MIIPQPKNKENIFNEHIYIYRNPKYKGDVENRVFVS